MLANNNRAVINKLAGNSIKTNRKPYGILFVTIFLSAFMLFCVFTIGITYLDSSRLQNTRLNGSEYDIATMNGFTPEQLETLQENQAIKSVGIESYAGFIRSTEFDNTVEIGLLWCDDVFWNHQMSSARSGSKGRYPQNKNELMVTKDVLKTFGNENLSIGDSFVVTYENNTGIHTDEFTISGIWDGYGDKSAAFVSKSFYDETGYDLKKDGILCIKLKHNYVFPTVIQSIEKSLDLSDRQIFVPDNYIQNSFKLLMGICGLALIICLSAYLLIYNILYLSVSGKIRYYGLLQSLGMTKKQLKLFIVKQMVWIGAAGILLGVSFALLSCLKLIPYIMNLSGISTENMNLRSHLSVFVITILVCGISIICGMTKPIQIAADVTPIEATKYRGSVSTGKGYRKKSGFFFWRMALEQLKKDKKKTVFVLLSLATSLSVFYCLTTIISSQGERTVMPNYWNADYIVKNQTQIPEEIHSLQPAIDDVFIETLEKMNGIKNFHILEGVPVRFPYIPKGFSDMWIRNYIERTPYLSSEEVIANYKENPENYYGMLKGIDEEEFDYLNQSLDIPVDKHDFLNGKICIVKYDGSEIPKEYLNCQVSFLFQNQQYEITIGAVSYESYYTGRNIGATLIVSQNYLKHLTSQPTVLSVTIHYDKVYDEALEKEITALIEDSPYRNDLYFESQYENMKTIQESQGNKMELGAILSLLLLLVGMLNYANTIASNIQNRKLTFSVMESVGMSKKQLNRLLIREGILYAVFSILITLTLGSAITYVCFQSMNYIGISFKIPVIPLIFAIILILAICVIAPLLSYKQITKNRSIAERLRDYE